MRSSSAAGLALALVLAAPVLALAPEAQAQCYPGLPCADDAPAPRRDEPQDIPADIGPAPDLPDDAPVRSDAAQRCYVDDVRPPDDWLALRSEPSSRAGRQLRRLRRGQQFELTGDYRGQWYEVRLPDGQVGWVSWQVSRWIAC